MNNRMFPLQIDTQKRVYVCTLPQHAHIHTYNIQAMGLFRIVMRARQQCTVCNIEWYCLQTTDRFGTEICTGMQNNSMACGGAADVKRRENVVDFRKNMRAHWCASLFHSNRAFVYDIYIRTATVQCIKMLSNTHTHTYILVDYEAFKCYTSYKM